jgi:hypothetical protein
MGLSPIISKPILLTGISVTIARGSWMARDGETNAEDAAVLSPQMGVKTSQSLGAADLQGVEGGYPMPLGFLNTLTVNGCTVSLSPAPICLLAGRI